MSVRVNLPPGCYGLDLKDGTRYTAKKAGGTVNVDERHASAINQGQFGQKGLVNATGQLTIGTKAGRWCRSCNRLWQAWTHTCNKCGSETEVETQ